MGLSYSVQSIRKNCSSMGSLHGPIGPATTLLQHGVSTGCSFLQGTSTCPGMVFHRQQCRHLLHHGPMRAAGAQSASPWSSPRVARDSPLWHLEYLLPAFFTAPRVCGSACLTFLLLTLTDAMHHFPPFLKYTFPDVPPSWLRCSVVSSGVSVGPIWKWLEPAMSSTG